MDGLTAKQKQFTQEYIIDLNATQAAIRAGYSARTANEMAVKLMKSEKIQSAIQSAMKARSERTEITQDMVLRRWWDIATADPNEIIHLRRVCCRYCFGVDHQYQWRDETEYQRAVDVAYAEAKKEAEKSGDYVEPTIPSDAGGYGFNRLKEPHKGCPYCLGEGSAEVHIEDTRKLGPKAKLLYAGIKQTAAGIEVKFQDQGKALENTARHLGMFTEKHEHSGPGGGPMEIVFVSGEDK